MFDLSWIFKALQAALQGKPQTAPQQSPNYQSILGNYLGAYMTPQNTSTSNLQSSMTQTYNKPQVSGPNRPIPSYGNYTPPHPGDLARGGVSWKI